MTAKEQLLAMSKNAKGNPESRKAYPIELRLKAVAMLRDTNYDYDLVATKTGVCKNTLRGWLCRYKDIKPDQASSLIMAKAEINLQRSKMDFISGHLKDIDALADAAIQKALELIEVEEDLNKVTGTLKIITDFFLKMSTPKEEEGTNTSSMTVNLIQDSIRRLNGEIG